MPRTDWRPCCGACRSERLESVDEQPPSMPRHYWRCRDCGSIWDGSELSAEEALERPARPGLPPGASGKAGASGRRWGASAVPLYLD